MGEVWRAIDPRLGREVAIKILPDSLAADAEFRTRFLREARVAARHVATGSRTAIASRRVSIRAGASSRKIAISSRTKPGFDGLIAPISARTLVSRTLARLDSASALSGLPVEGYSFTNARSRKRLSSLSSLCLHGKLVAARQR
jgi:hypothetical protein